jgi:hypothetical protein
VAVPVLRHRISTNFQAQAEGLTTEDLILRLVKEVPEPEIPRFPVPRLLPVRASRPSPPNKS